MRTTAVAIVAASIAGAAHADDTWGTWTPDAVPTTTEVPVYSSTVEPIYPTSDASSTVDVIPTSSTVEPEYTTTDVYPVYSTEEPVYSTEEPVYTTTVSTDDATPTTTEGGAWGSWTGTSTTTPEVEATSSSSSTTTSCTESSETTSTVGVYTSKATYESPVYTTKKTPDTPEKPETTEGWQPVYETSSSVVYESTTTLTSTVYKTVTVWPTPTATDTPSATWAEWASASTSGWSSSGWWGPSWPTAGPGQCVMNVVTGYGEATWVPETTKPATSSAPAVYTTVPAAYTTASAPSYSAPAYSAPPATPSKPSGGHGMTPNGNYWGMTYSPYTADSGCKSQETINEDIKKMAAKGFSSVRVYSTDCNTLEYVGSACKAHNIKVILGVFISDTGVAGTAKQITDITQWAQWDLVELIVVGNEAVFNGYVTADELADLINSAKGTFKAAGYTGAVTTTEDLATWTSVGSKWCGSVDVVAANLYAYFNPDTTPDKAGDLIQAQLDELAQVCGDKETYVMESGWPSEGSCNNKACPGKEEQATAIKSIQATNGAKVIFFSYEDELWKKPGQYGVEQHWGCGDVFPDTYA